MSRRNDVKIFNPRYYPGHMQTLSVFTFLSVLFKINLPRFLFFYHAHSIDALKIRRELGL